MLLLATLCLIQSTKTVDLAPGYYRLQRLSGVLAQQGVSLSVDANCASDLYVFYAQKLPASDLMAALAGDGRLNVTKTETGYAIKHDPDRLHENASTLLKWTDAISIKLAQSASVALGVRSVCGVERPSTPDPGPKSWSRNSFGSCSAPTGCRR